MATSKICSIQDCGKPHKGRGWCRSHYERWRDHGDPLAGGKQRPPKGSVNKYMHDIVLPYAGTECLIWPYSRTKFGYGQISVEAGYPAIVSVIVCEHVNGPKPTPKHQAAHECGNGHLGCVSPIHMAWKTSKENIDDKIRHGTDLRGEACSHSKLTEADVLFIRKMDGIISRKSLSERFGIKPSTISGIVLRLTWAHVF